MSLEISQPFTLDNNGQIQNVSSPSLQVDQHVNTLVSTIQGERVMLPTYGLNLSGMIFNPNDEALLNIIQQSVIQQFGKWEPSLQLTSVQPSPASDAQVGVAAVNVSYIVGSNQVGSAGKVQNKTVTITQGGTVVSAN
jgi:phage baseplate assembly protein W